MLAVVGSVSLDRIDGGPPRIGGGPYYAARALRSLHIRALIVAKCAAPDRSRVLPPLASSGSRSQWRDSQPTTAFAIDYDGEHRRMLVEAIADPWTPDEVRAARRDLGARGAARAQRLPAPRRSRPSPAAGGSRSTARGSSAPARARAARARRRLRPGRCSRSVSILKLAEDEAELLVDGLDERALGPARRAGGRRHARLARVHRLRTTGRRARSRPAGRRAPTRPAPATPSPPRTSPRGAAARRRPRPRGAPARSSPTCSRGAPRDRARRRRRTGSPSSTSTTRPCSSSTRTRALDQPPQPPVSAAARRRRGGGRLDRSSRSSTRSRR